ncbi:DsbA family oxidoreductase [Roseobacter sp. HKCCA0434]|uniref:DsbA family oxidoreductase n=1 Tax=Roseobacter sp. HKCCA0434 TaxID=3079297 RepID=UPI002905CEEA|nr:DsbA family oxidoreductase [Roseobacter sp. HKCCA0434]
MTRLDILSDPICPWCYIGKAKLDAALAATPYPFEITWRPFQLNPDMPPEGMDRRAYLNAKFGEERATAFYAQIEQAARDAGLEVNFDAIERTPSTIDAHRVIRWAGQTGDQGALKDALFRAYFVEGKDISDRDLLAELGAEAGLEADVTRRLLDGDADVAEVKAEDAEARQMGVTGVPTFLIGGRYAVQGAQDTATWEGIIADLSAARDQMTEGGASAT